MATTPYLMKYKLELKNDSVDAYKTTIQNATLTANRTLTLPNVDSTLASANNDNNFTAFQTFTVGLTAPVIGGARMGNTFAAPLLLMDSNGLNFQPTVDADSDTYINYVGYNGGVTRTRGLIFGDGKGVIAGIMTAAGAWTLGKRDTAGTPKNYNTNIHTIRGSLFSDIQASTSDQSGLWMIGTNCRYGAAGALAGRTDSSTSGAAIAIQNTNASGTPVITFLANQVSDATNTTADEFAWMTGLGAWVFTANTTHSFGNTTVADNTVLALKTHDTKNAYNTFTVGATAYALTGCGAAGALITGAAKGDYCISANGVGINFSGNNGTTLHGSMSTAGAWSMPSLAAGAGTYPLKWTTSSGLLTYDTSTKLMKKEIVDTPYGLKEILALRPVKYTYINTEVEDLGLIAEEVYEIMPELCPMAQKKIYTKIETDTELVPSFVNYDRLVSVCVKAIQELSAKLGVL